ncbi:MAG: hypothetical protein ABW082_15450 [Sedimenticola sp.]
MMAENRHNEDLACHEDNVDMQGSLQHRIGIQLLAALFLAAPLSVSAMQSQQPVNAANLSPYTKLTRSVADADPLQRQDFAWIALSEIAHAYEQELKNSDLEQPNSRKRVLKLARWRKGIRSFIEQLHGHIDLLQRAEDVQLQADGSGPAILFIDDNPVVLSGPENGMAKLMEQRIIDSYCSLHDCSTLQKAPEPPKLDEGPIAGGKWIFQHGRFARYETPDNLVFVFRSLDGRSEKQQACENIASELRQLAAAIRQAKRAGHRIDWSMLTVQPLENNSKSHVLLNGNGDYLQLKLPYLQRSQLLDENLVLWTKKRSSGDSTPATFINTDRFLNSSTVQDFG